MKFSALVFGSLILSVAALPQLHAQNYVISTFAGGGAPLQTPAPALTVPIAIFPGPLTGIATDTAGNAYIASPTLNCVFKLDPNGVLTRVAGSGRGGYSGDGGPATQAQLNNPGSVAVDGTGNLFIGEVDRVRRVSPSGIITTIAGNGVPTYSGDGGPAADAQLSVRALAVDGSGNLFVADPFNYRIRKITPDGLIATIAGNGSNAFSGDNAPATAAELSGPIGVAVDSAGNVFIVDGLPTNASLNPGQPFPSARVRKISTTGIITTVAGGGSAPCCTIPPLGDGGPATSAVLFLPQGVQGVTTDDAGNLYFGDGSRLRKVTPDGIISTVAGNGASAYSGDGGPATSAQLENVTAVAIDSAQALWIGDGPRVRRISADGIITTVAGNGASTCCFLGDGGPATSAQLSSPWDVAADAAGNVFIADTGNQRIRKVSPDGVISTVTASGQSYSLWGLTVDPKGNLLIADSPTNVIRRVAPDGSSTIFAGNGTPGFSGDGGPATSAQLEYPSRVAADRAGNILIIDGGGTRIRKVSPDGNITTLAGAGSHPYAFSGDGGPAVNAELDTWDADGCDGPGGGMAVDDAGDVYFADSYNNRIREIAPNGIINTIVGNGNYGFSGDGGPVNNARFAEPFSLAFDPAGNLFIADLLNSRIRKVTPDSIITTVAGNGTPGFSGDGGLSTASSINYPSSIAADAAGNIYVADTYNNAVRILRPTNLTTFIKTVVDAASQRADPVSPGKIVTIYGYGLGPSQLTQNQASGGVFGTSLSGTSVMINGVAAPILYSSADQVGVVVPYEVAGTSAQVTLTYQGQVSNSFTVSVALVAPSLFTANETGAGQAAAVNADGTLNSATNPVKIGESITLFATGGGQTSPPGVDGALSGSTASQLLLPVSATIGGIPANVQALGSAPGQVAGVMQVTLQVPGGVQAGGYVPVVLQVGNATSTDGAVWIGVSGN